MENRLKQFQADQKNLKKEDILAAADFNRWLYDYGTYIMFGGDRPPKKPPTPLTA